MQRWSNCFITTPSLFFFFLAVLSFLFGIFWGFLTSYVRRAHFTFEVDFYFMLTHFLDVIIEILGYLVEPPVSCLLSPLLWSQLSAFIISGKASERMFTHWDCVHSPQCFSFQRILFLSLHWGLACKGRQIGVWAVTRLLFCGVLKVQTSLSWSFREGDRGIDSEWEEGC